MQRKIRAFCGSEGSGKSYSTGRLVMTKGYKSIAFADPLRDIAFKIIGLSFEDGMKEYEKLKRTDIINGLTFRNILENLGAGVRRYDTNFWARALLTEIRNCPDNIAISDLRYYNEYATVRDYAKDNNIDFQLVFCDYHSNLYREDNPHESARLARYLKDLGYIDQQFVDDFDMENYANIERSYNKHNS